MEQPELSSFESPIAHSTRALESLIAEPPAGFSLAYKVALLMALETQLLDFRLGNRLQWPKGYTWEIPRWEGRVENTEILDQTSRSQHAV